MGLSFGLYVTIIDVEHSNNSTVPINATGVPQLQYEGFELPADEPGDPQVGLEEAYSVRKRFENNLIIHSYSHR